MENNSTQVYLRKHVKSTGACGCGTDESHDGLGTSSVLFPKVPRYLSGRIIADLYKFVFLLVEE